MKRPFYFVKDRHTNKAVNNDIFAIKSEAKSVRNSMNPPRDDEFVSGTPERFYVSKVVLESDEV